MDATRARRVGSERPPIPLDLAGVLGDSADLRDGLCVGDWDTWDPQNDGETADVADARHQRAIALSQSGPVLAECAA